MNDQTFRATVERRLQLSDVHVELTLTLPADRAASGDAGAHVDIHLPDGAVRQYSLISSTDREWRICVLVERDGRGGSAWLADHAGEGTELVVSGPRNHFPFTPRPESRIVFVAGGIGITPMLPMIMQAARTGRDWRLHYVAQDASHLVYADTLREFGDRVSLYPRATTPRPDLEAITLGAHVDVFACGPESLLAAVEELGRRKEHIDVHVERFVPRPTDDDEFGFPQFVVDFQRTGVVGTVGPDDTILSVAESLGIRVESSCREGTCGTCETDIISGTVSHRDSVLSDLERAASETMMICRSRATCPRLVLDL